LGAFPDNGPYSAIVQTRARQGADTGRTERVHFCAGVQWTHAPLAGCCAAGAFFAESPVKSKRSLVRLTGLGELHRVEGNRPSGRAAPGRFTITYLKWRMFSVLITQDALDLAAVTDVTQAVSGVAGVLHGTKMMLFTNTPALNKGTLLAALTPANYTGYAPQALTWSAPSRNENQYMSTRTGLMSWEPTDGVTPNTITGYGITDSAGAVLLAAEMLPAPVPLTDAFSFLGIVSEYTPASLNAGQCTVVT
jgi:hypothetical protein